MRHLLSEEQKQHLVSIGVPEPPEHLDVDDEEYRSHLRAWSTSKPNSTPAELHKCVMGHIAWGRHAAAEREKEKIKPAPYVDGKPLAAHIVNHPAPLDLGPLIFNLRVGLAILVVILLVLLGVTIAKADPIPPTLPEFNAAHYLVLHPYTFAQSIPVPLPVRGSGSSSPVYVICSSGCSAAGAFADNSAFTVGTTPGSILFGYYTSGSAPTLSSGNAARARIDASSYLFVDCAVGCAGGSFNNNADAVATSSTNGQSAAWLYGFNGTTFDRLRVDGSKNLEVNINASSATVPVSGTFWQTTQPVSGTFWQATQPVSGTFFQATQPVSIASAQVASGAYALGSLSDGAIVTQGAKADAKSTATDTTAVTVMQVTKEISFMEQNPASRAVTNAGTFAVQDATVEGAISSSVMQSNTKQIGGTAVVAAPCEESAPIPFFYDASTSGKTQLIALSSGKKIYVCKMAISQSTSTTVSVSLGSGTGTNCGTTYNVETPAWPIQGPTSVGPTGISMPGDKIPWFNTNASEELCVSTTAGVSVQIIGSAVQF